MSRMSSQEQKRRKPLLAKIREMEGHAFAYKALWEKTAKQLSETKDLLEREKEALPGTVNWMRNKNQKDLEYQKHARSN